MYCTIVDDPSHSILLGLAFPWKGFLPIMMGDLSVDETCWSACLPLESYGLINSQIDIYSSMRFNFLRSRNMTPQHSWIQLWSYISGEWKGTLSKT